MSRLAFVFLWALFLIAHPCARAEELNLFAWSEVAPVVVSGTSLGEDGKYVDFRADRVFRGEVLPGSVLLVDQRHANNSRDRLVDPKALRMVAGEEFVILLEPAFKRKKDDATIYRIPRGVRGARPLPKESGEALLAALARIVEIQDLDSESLSWRRMTDLLEETDPFLLSVALDQFLRFRRGDPELLPLVLPILDHPGPLFRTQASRLIGQILEYNKGEEIPDALAVRAELIARARRDESAGVRVAATQALLGFPSADIIDVLEEISADDPDQEVRYAAQLLLISLREEGYQGRRYAGSSD